MSDENKSNFAYITIVAIVAIVAVVVMMSGNTKVQSTDLTGQATMAGVSKVGGEQVYAPIDCSCTVSGCDVPGECGCKMNSFTGNCDCTSCSKYRWIYADEK
jgi:hypothetical protein